MGGCLDCDYIDKPLDEEPYDKCLLQSNLTINGILADDME